MASIVPPILAAIPGAGTPGLMSERLRVVI
jgi:hypothetical protein